MPYLLQLAIKIVTVHLGGNATFAFNLNISSFKPNEMFLCGNLLETRLPLHHVMKVTCISHVWIGYNTCNSTPVKQTLGNSFNLLMVFFPFWERFLCFSPKHLIYIKCLYPDIDICLSALTVTKSVFCYLSMWSCFCLEVMNYLKYFFFF